MTAAEPQTADQQLCWKCRRQMRCETGRDRWYETCLGSAALISGILPLSFVLAVIISRPDLKAPWLPAMAFGAAALPLLLTVAILLRSWIDRRRRRAKA